MNRRDFLRTTGTLPLAGTGLGALAMLIPGEKPVVKQYYYQEPDLPAQNIGTSDPAVIEAVEKFIAENTTKTDLAQPFLTSAGVKAFDLKHVSKRLEASTDDLVRSK